MNERRALATFLVAIAFCGLPKVASAQQGTNATKLASVTEPAPSSPPGLATANPSAAAAPASPAKQEDEDALRLDGEKRFHANCGRCHQAPHKLSPRMMATAIRHMRVRATITNEDMRVILHYMTQ